MNKAELIKAIADKTGATQKDVTALLDAYVETVIDTLKKGEEVTLVGFGTFKTAQRAARDGRNPKTGAVLKIKACRVARFTAGKVLKEAVL